MRKNKSKKILSPTNLPEVDWSFLLTKAPPLLWRHKWSEYVFSLGLPHSRGTMANLDSSGEGPERVIFRGRIGYRREALVKWLNSRQSEGR